MKLHKMKFSQRVKGSTAGIFKCWCGEQLMSADSKSATKAHLQILDSDKPVKVKVTTRFKGI